MSISPFKGRLEEQRSKLQARAKRPLQKQTLNQGLQGPRRAQPAFKTLKSRLEIAEKLCSFSKGSRLRWRDGWWSLFSRGAWESFEGWCPESTVASLPAAHRIVNQVRTWHFSLLRAKPLYAFWRLPSRPYDPIEKKLATFVSEAPAAVVYL